MGNLGGGEILVILLVALIVLGPTRLPPAVRQVGKVVGEIRRIGQGFQEELREASKPLAETTAAMKAADPRKVIAPPPETKGKGGDVAKKAKDTSGKGSDATGPASWGTAAVPASAGKDEGAVTPAGESETVDGAPAASGEDTDIASDAPSADEPDAGGSEVSAGESDAGGSEVSAGESDAGGSEVSAGEPDAGGSEVDEQGPESRSTDAA